MKTGELIFVYGTLRRGERADLAKQQHNFGVAFIGDDKVNGKLYHLGSFPGLKHALFEEDGFLPDEPTVTGECFRILDASVTSLLDAYEGYVAPEDRTPAYQGLYDRCQVYTERGRRAWVYTFNGPVIEEQRIESGDWCKNQSNPVSTRRLRA
jgi:gamma-glutamylcyclotransferase (GGCT)/AIG2-like uncharacterized protein YtfP